MKRLFYLLLFFSIITNGQETISKELSYNEFLGYVKKYHPLVKNAQLELNKAQAELMMARGSFDPKIDVDYSKKQFKDKEYYSLLNSSFKIPTWYGVEIKAGFDNNEGYYLNPENTTPNQGLTSLGISVPLGQGLWINKRMADLRKAKMQIELSKSEVKLEAITVLYDASLAYFNWKKNYEEVKLYESYSTNAKKRNSGIQSLIQQGDKPAIDSVEAGIAVKNRLLSLEDSRLKLAKAKLELSNYLWLDNAVPMEISDSLIPEAQLENTIQETLQTNNLTTDGFSIENHPKINALQRKIDILNVERKLNANELLPKIDVGYSYLSQPKYFNDFQTDDYKIGLDFSFPLFLRKERGKLKLTKYKIQETEYILDVEKMQLSNKIQAQNTEILSLSKQLKLIKDLSKDNQTMLQSEERLFSFGESSLFLINTRENNLISAQLAQINLANRFYVSNSELFKIMANPN
ncbi:MULTISPECIES: TolC family protein [Flavobacterium]|uniref:TolC family protein n=1 Tax=Flavobacterium cupriresistens TaxID=2893885 RepID=A0ABU4R8Q2_9FLAO|nr:MULTISPECIES: TolC family protein [unclassified Flavobacterium]KLT68605.1 transporter [Flavobacterium sp. ABG]MDX6188937.1 TolC family protein [Flavobacterium sp. Fl-318]UFH44282.1 TolC family protein [Flavobacterium sp. F-323]